MTTKRGTTYEYGDFVFGGWIDDNTGEIIELDASFECPGYWGDNVKIVIEPSEQGGWGWYGGVNNQMADYMSNSWETWASNEGFDDIDEAIEDALAWVTEKQEQYC